MIQWSNHSIVQWLNGSMIRPIFRLNIGGKTVRLGERTLIMGVVNVTPDSFSDGGLYLDAEAAIARAVELARQGADWIDVGGESTRPGSRPIPAEEEAERILPVIRGIRRKLPSLPISVDTNKAWVAEQAISEGADILNDISGLRFDPDVAKVARRHKTPLILMHIRGKPESMQQRPFARSIWRSLRQGLEWSVSRALTYGVHRSQLIIDPGLGFGKSRSQNYEILKQLDRLQPFDLPILVGSSRKSFIRVVVMPEQTSRQATRSHVKNSAQKSRDAGATSQASSAVLQLGDAAAVVAAILNGAHIVRVHDVEHIIPAVRIADAIAGVK